MPKSYTTTRETPSEMSDLSFASTTAGLVTNNAVKGSLLNTLTAVHVEQNGIPNTPRRELGAGQRALGAGWLCVAPRCAGRSPHSALGPASEGAEHQAGSSSGQIYCKPNYPEECHLWTWTCASDHPAKCTQMINYPS